ncbi:MAG: hypothetical protein IH796_07270 [Deltaproteobacteria bacterium]|nr:hypothetical protein [Deltaproteobacteria bacterium]
MSLSQAVFRDLSLACSTLLVVLSEVEAGGIMKADKGLTEDTISIQYKFTFSDKSVREFNVRLDGETLSLIRRERSSVPDWTRLSYRKCPNCPLSDKLHPNCPIALNLVEVVEFFKNSISYEEVDVEIITEARNYLKHSDLQTAISSLIGIFMVTSGCPVMDKLRPMVKTHLPFATPEETIYRILSMYLLAQYFVCKDGQNLIGSFKIFRKFMSRFKLSTRVFVKGFQRFISKMPA